MVPANLALSFDIGYASVGWAVFLLKDPFPSLLGSGSVLFQKDSCLASSRRAFRRSRRNIAARRSRVARFKKYLASLGVLEREQLNENACAFPWMLAARVLASDGKEKLSWQELWHVLRWYAHNRGYDGNALWAGDALDETGADEEDTQKVKAARALMEKYGKTTMAETVCADLQLEPFGEKRASRRYFKGNNAAFPRETVRDEVRRILLAHAGVLPKVDDALVATLLNDVPENLCAALRLPARFSAKGGLLFGQYVPRFDNRIIGHCRITGKNVPLKNCREYLLYRWGRLLNNLTVFARDGSIRTLSADKPNGRPSEREKLDAEMRSRGFFDKKKLNDLLKEITGCEPANTESYFLIPEMEDALILDPVRKLIATKKLVKDFWGYFSERGKKIFAAELAKGETLKLSDCIKRMDDWGGWKTKPLFAAALEKLKAAEMKKKPEKRRNLLNLRIKAEFPTGRASYCREILKKTYEEALAGKDSTQPGGCLYETPEIRERLLRGNTGGNDAGTVSTEQWLAEQTNNHMVRHRMLIFSRLLRDIIREYAEGDAARVKDVVVEVVRELKEFSGLSAQEIATKLNEKFANFNSVAEKIEAVAQEKGVSVSASLIRKARLIEDQDFAWPLKPKTDLASSEQSSHEIPKRTTPRAHPSCPYTGQVISYNELFSGALEIEHIIPRSLRPSDALSSCVMTFRAVNDMKGQRTAMQFMKECAGKNVPGTNLQIQPLADFKKWVEAHRSQKLRRGFSKEDQARCKRRAELLLVERYEERNADFTERDLTQTSHLNKLAIRLVKRELGIDARHLAGAVTGLVRKNLSIDECLVAAVPRMQRAQRVSEHDSRKLLKSQMRELSHLHHAMDAITQGLTGILFRVEDWKLLVKRHLTERERAVLAAKYPTLLRVSANGEIALKPLPDSLLSEITARLKECRVMQHVPAKMHGMAVEQTTWSIVSQDEATRKVLLEQHTTDLKKGRYKDDGARFVKNCEEKPTLLLGFGVPEGQKSKLQTIKGVVKISENWGCALDPEPVVIPYFKVFPRIRELRERNGGKPVRVLRRGQQIEVLSGNYKGVWTIVSIKDSQIGIVLDMNHIDKVQIESRTEDSKREVRLKSLLGAGLKILKPPLTGFACPTTSSR